MCHEDNQGSASRFDSRWVDRFQKSGRAVLSLILLTGLQGFFLKSALQAEDPTVREPRNLFTYLDKPEPKFSWKLNSKSTTLFGTLHDLELVSQEWQGIVWSHHLQIYETTNSKPAATMLIWNTGGKPNTGSAAFGYELSRLVQAPVAILYDIPNQPLLDGKKEDALIAETFVRCLSSHDTTWPLLFPMTKSLHKAMDTLQAYGKEAWKGSPKQFVISGASKRGWTTWLTAASDPRVKAFAPLVIDTLNMQEQLKHQLECFGAYSEMIHDYTERKLIPLPPGNEARLLWLMVDPYTYRERYRMPKLIINGNNDPYWTLDALQLYWNGIPGDKWITYVPNAGHDLKQQDAKPGTERVRAIHALAAFTRSQITDQPFPRMDWKFENLPEEVRLVLHANPPGKSGRLWVTESDTRDFRKSTWKEQPIQQNQGKYTGSIQRPKKGFRAFWLELDCEIDGIPFTLSTQLEIVGPR